MHKPEGCTNPRVGRHALGCLGADKRGRGKKAERKKSDRPARRHHIPNSITRHLGKGCSIFPEVGITPSSHCRVYVYVMSKCTHSEL
jgi:hypothetical protein